MPLRQSEGSINERRRASRTVAEAYLPDLSSLTPDLPEQLRKTLIWDRGKELSGHAQFTLDAGTKVFFDDPHSAWRSSAPTAARPAPTSSEAERQGDDVSAEHDGGGLHLGVRQQLVE